MPVPPKPSHDLIFQISTEYMKSNVNGNDLSTGYDASTSYHAKDLGCFRVIKGNNEKNRLLCEK